MAGEIRFMSNNGVESANLTKSTQNNTYPITNIQNQNRSNYWVQTGYFNVTTSNNQIYINDGSDITASVTVGEYETRAQLATGIQTALNTVSTNWTCTHDSNTGYFTVDRTSGTKILRLSQTTNSIWDLIGYTGSIDITSGIADEVRWHEYEYVIVDHGASFPCDFFAMIGPSGEDFSISGNGEVLFQANSVNNWTSPPLNEVAQITSDGIFHFSSATSPSYRYNRIKITDRTNSLNSFGLPISHIYVGDYTTLSSTNVQRGFSYSTIDPSKPQETIGGQIFFDSRKKYTRYTGLAIRYLTEDERITLETEFSRNGISNAFYMSLDPLGSFSTNINTFTKFVRYSREPQLQHVFLDRFSLQFEAREVL